MTVDTLHMCRRGSQNIFMCSYFLDSCEEKDVVRTPTSYSSLDLALFLIPRFLVVFPVRE